MLQPIDVEGDGSCLFHSVSRALFGLEVFNRVLRSMCVAEMEAHKAWYAQHLYSDSEDTVLEFIGMIREPTSEAPTTALVALAHVLRRPVVLLSSLADMSDRAEALGIGVYLPARLDPKECCPHPLLLAWGRASHDHYVPLCRTTDSGQVLELPQQCRPVPNFPRRTKELPGAYVERYIPSHCWHLNTTRLDELEPKSLLFPRPADQLSAFDALYEKLFKKCVTDAKALLRDVSVEEAEMLLSPSFASEAELAAEAQPAWLKLAALVQYEAGREAHEVLTRREMRTGVDALCIDAWAELMADLPEQLVASLTVAQLTQCELAIRTTGAIYASKGLLTATSVLESMEDADAIAVRCATICFELRREKLLAEILATIQAADVAAQAEARAKAEAEAEAAAKAREAEFHEALMNALVNSQHRQPRWAPSALARCAPITSHVSHQHDCISRAALPHIPTA